VTALLEVKGLKTQFNVRGRLVRAVDGVDFRVNRGETVGLVGESGAGKSMTALSVLRLVPEPGRIVGGSITFDGRNVLAMNRQELRRFRGNDAAMIFQEPMSSLNPVLKVGSQVEEAMRFHDRFSHQEARSRVPLLLRRVRIPDAGRRANEYPFQFSGGMRQRVMIAMGVSNEPGMLIADEPTTALDVTVQAQILEQLRELNHELGAAIMLITHNMALVANICTWVVVMYAGRVVEQGPTDEIFRDPQHPYTWSLLRSIPRIDDKPGGRMLPIPGLPPDLTNLPPGCTFHPRCRFSVDRCSLEEPPLEIVGPERESRCWVQMASVSDRDAVRANMAVAGGYSMLRPEDGSPRAGAASEEARGKVLVSLLDVVKHFPSGNQTVRGVDGVSLEILAGETLGLVGESGCGKSTLGSVVAQLQPATSGQVVFDGQDLAVLSRERLRQVRRRIQMIFQDPYASLNPRMTVGTIIGEPLRNFGLAKGKDRDAQVQDVMRICGLNPNFSNRYPHEFSGGQRQRIGIARALVLHPEFVIADEPVSALDVSIQAQIINLLEDLQEAFKLTYLFIAHDLAVVRHISDRIVVMYLGVVVEVASSADLYDNPLHPYTTALLQSIPIPDPVADRDRKPIILRGEIPSPIDPPRGCRFHPRCPIAEPICSEVRPALVDYGDGHVAACHFAGRLQGSVAAQVSDQSVAEVRAALVADSALTARDVLEQSATMTKSDSLEVFEGSHE
jgi:peptide/nickel transport system ATP-binding protein